MKRKKLSLGARFGLWFLSFLLGIALFVSALATVGIASVRVMTSENTIQEIVRLLISSPARIHTSAMSPRGTGGLHVSTRPGTRTYAIPRRDNDSTVISGIVVGEGGTIIVEGTLPDGVNIGEGGSFIIDGESYESFVGEDGSTVVIVGNGNGNVNIEDIIGNDDLMNNSGNLDFGDVAGGGITDQIIESLYDELQNQLGDDLNVSLEEVNNMLEQSTVKDFIADKATSLITDYLTGEVTTTFEAEEIKNLINENSELIETVLGQPLPEEVTDMIIEWVDQSEVIQQVNQGGLQGILESSGMSPDQILGGAAPGKPSDSGNALGEQLGSMLGSDEIAGSIAGVAGALTGGQLQGIDNFSDILTILRSVTSDTNFITCIVICVVLMALILLVNIRQIATGIRRCGYPLLFAGFLFIVCLVVKPMLPVGVDPILTVISIVFTKTMTINGIVFGTGAALVLIGLILAIVLASKNNAAVPVSVGVGSPAAEELSEKLEALTEPAAAAPAEDDFSDILDEIEESKEPAEAPAEEYAEEEAPETV